MMGYRGRTTTACAAAIALLIAACSSSEIETLSCGDFLDADQQERRTLVASVWQADGGGGGRVDAPSPDDVEGVCQDLPTLHLGPALRSAAAEAAAAGVARSATSTTAVDRHDDGGLNVRGVRQIIPIVAAGGAGTSGALAEIAAVCVAESVGPHVVASAFSEPVVVADDEVCYRLGPVLFETMSVGSVAVEGDENVAARRVTIQLTSADADRFSQLTSAAAAATADVPTGRLALLLGGTLLDVVAFQDTVHDGTVTLQAGGRSFNPAIVALLEGMTEAP